MCGDEVCTRDHLRGRRGGWRFVQLTAVLGAIAVTGRVTAAIPVGAAPWGVAITP